MKKDTYIPIWIQLNTQDAQKNVNELGRSLDSLEESLRSIAQWDFDGMLIKLDSIVTSITTAASDIGELLGNESVGSSISEIVNAFERGLEIGKQAIDGQYAKQIQDMLISLGELANETFIPALAIIEERILQAFGNMSLGSMGQFAVLLMLIIAMVKVLVENWEE